MEGGRLISPVYENRRDASTGGYPADVADEATPHGGDEANERLVLSVVVPVYNETGILPEFYRRLAPVLQKLRLRSEIVFVNDGSTDFSLCQMQDLQRIDGRIAIVNLSRNFGKEVAVTAGLDHSRGDAVVIIDADLQDPPEVIPCLVDRWREGHDVVYARQRERCGETWFMRTSAGMFYRVMRHVGEMPIPENTGDLRLLSRRCLEAVVSCRERRRFMKGLFAWVGFKQTSIIYDRAPRLFEKTKQSYWRLWNVGIEGITSSTIVPLKLAMYFGLITAVVALIYAGYITCRTIVLGRELPGYASLMVAVLLMAGVRLIAIGVIGEYIGRIFVESKGRPLYVLDGYSSPRGIGNRVASDDVSRPFLGKKQEASTSEGSHGPVQRGNSLDVADFESRYLL